MLLSCVVFAVPSMLPSPYSLSAFSLGANLRILPFFSSSFSSEVCLENKASCLETRQKRKPPFDLLTTLSISFFHIISLLRQHQDFTFLGFAFNENKSSFPFYQVIKIRRVLSGFLNIFKDFPKHTFLHPSEVTREHNHKPPLPSPSLTYVSR